MSTKVFFYGKWRWRKQRKRDKLGTVEFFPMTNDFDQIFKLVLGLSSLQRKVETMELILVRLQNIKNKTNLSPEIPQYIIENQHNETDVRTSSHHTRKICPKPHPKLHNGHLQIKTGEGKEERSIQGEKEEKDEQQIKENDQQTKSHRYQLGTRAN